MAQRDQTWPGETIGAAVLHFMSGECADPASRVRAMVGSTTAADSFGGSALGDSAPGGAADLPTRLPPGRGGGCSGPLLVMPETEAEVLECVRYAKNLGLSVSVIGGAHTPYSSLGQMVLDLQRFSDVAVDQHSRTITVGGGARAKPILEAAQAKGLMVALGTAPTVGLGLVLQGGIGHMSRQLGLALDGIVSARVVVADGRCVVASRAENAELLWALSGCGPNFGAVLSLTLAAHPAKTLSVAAHVLGCGSAGAWCTRTLLASYGERAAALPRSASADAILHFRKDGTMALGIYDYRLRGLGPGDECVRAAAGVGAGLMRDVGAAVHVRCRFRA